MKLSLITWATITQFRKRPRNHQSKLTISDCRFLHSRVRATLRDLCIAVGWRMKKLGLFSFAITALIGLSQPAHGGPSDRSDSYYYYPSDATYDSFGRVPTVRQVQRALEEEGYYTGDNRGNFCYETRVAVRRYQRDKGLVMTGKIDAPTLKALGLR